MRTTTKSLICVCTLILAILAIGQNVLGSQDYMLVVPNEAPGQSYVARPVLRFFFEGTGPLSQLPSIPADLVGLVPYAAFNAEGELFLTNRQNPQNGSISRFKFDENLNYIPNGTITDTYGDTHGLAFNGSGELFTVDTYSGIISRFVFGADGTAISNGLIIPDPTRPSYNSHGLAFSQNGELFISHAYNTLGIHRYLIDPSNGSATFNGQFSIPGANRYSGLTFSSNGELFVADQYSGTPRVWRYKFVDGNPVLNGSIQIVPAGDPIGVAFSPEGELFVTGGWSGGIWRFLFDNAGNAIPNGYTSTVPLGGPAITSVTVNQSPDANSGGPYLVAVGSENAIFLDGSGSSDPDGDPLYYMWDQDEDNILGSFGDPQAEKPAYIASQAGVTNISLTVSDGQLSDTDTTLLVVYDPSGGFVTGGGWIISPEGALLGSDSIGKANFGFVAKYKKGATVPEGNTEFRFQAGNFAFKSTSYEWLVVAGSKAIFKGEGKIDGLEGTFKFMLTAVDDTQDKFRIKIWDALTDLVIYDNKRGEGDEAEPTVIGGGSVVIHNNN